MAEIGARGACRWAYEAVRAKAHPGGVGEHLYRRVAMAGRCRGQSSVRRGGTNAIPTYPRLQEWPMPWDKGSKAEQRERLEASKKKLGALMTGFDDVGRRVRTVGPQTDSGRQPAAGQPVKARHPTSDHSSQ